MTRPVIKSAAPSRILVQEGVLRPLCNLQRADYNTFQDACSELAASSSREVTLDLTRCTYLSSLFIGVLVDSVTQMKNDGKGVGVLVSPEVGRLLHMAHLYHLFTYEISDPK